MKMPRNGFDSLAAVARLNDDNTSHHRERWPSLDWVCANYTTAQKGAKI